MSLLVVNSVGIGCKRCLPLQIPRGKATALRRNPKLSTELAARWPRPSAISAPRRRDTLLAQATNPGPGKDHASDLTEETDPVRAVPGKLILAASGAGLLGTGFDVTGPESVLQAISLLALIVAVHEAGHFMAARLQNIHVTKFSIGFGPTLVKYQGAEVEYSLRAFPLGGFVAFPDDDPDSKFEEDDPDLLRNRPLLDRAIVISAGVAANFVFAYTILFTQVSTVGIGNPELLSGIKVPEIVRAGVADRGGLQGGDVIVKVNGAEIGRERGVVDKLVRQIKQSDGKAMQFEVLRGTEMKEFSLLPELGDDGYGRIGVQLVNNSVMKRTTAGSVPEAAKIAASEFTSLCKIVSTGLMQLFGNFQNSSKDVSGPLAIVAVGAEVARSDASGLYQFAALVNVNLGIVNLLPLPALDGGYLALIAVEAIRGGQKLEKNVEGAIMGSGLLILMTSGVFLIFRDIFNFVK